MSIVFKVGGVDLGPGGARALQVLTPQSAGVSGRVGTADATAAAAGGGGLDIQDAMPIQGYLWNDAGGYIEQVLFGGYIGAKAESRLEGTTWLQWRLTLQDYNIQFAKLVPLITGTAGLVFAPATFPAQVQAIVSACNDGASTIIDASSQVANLTGAAVLPALGPFYGANLGTMLDALFANVQIVAPAVRPLRALGPDYTVGMGRTSFGGPVLYIFDGALLAAPTMTLNEATAGDIVQAGYTRTLDRLDQVTRRQSIVSHGPFGPGEGPYYTGIVGAAVSAYPNDCAPDGTWAAEALIDDQTTAGDGAAGTAVLDGRVLSAALTSGSGYAVGSPPAVTIQGAGGAGAAAVAVLEGAALTSIAVGAGGTGYTAASATITGDGRDAVAGTVTIVSGSVTAIALTAGGHDYTQATIAIVGNGTGATASPVFATSHIRRIDVTEGGAAYQGEPAVLIAGSGGAVAYAEVVANRVVAVHLMTGTGYSSAPTPAIAPRATHPGSGATATATITGSVLSLSLGAGGSGFTSAPAVSLVGDGAGAAAHATLDGSGHVNGLVLDAPGHAYTTCAVNIHGGGGLGATGTATLTKRVNGLTLTAGGTAWDDDPLITFSGGGGTGATASGLFTYGLASVPLTSGGHSYSPPVLVGIQAPAGAGAGAAATVADTAGVLGPVTVTAPGQGYDPLNLPAIVFIPQGSIAGNAQATIDADVAATAYPRDTLEVTTQRAPPPLPGQVVRVTIPTVGLSAVDYVVSAVSSSLAQTATGGFLVTTKLTLGLPRLLLGETGKEALRPPAMLVPPAPPGNLRVTETHFDPAVGNSVVTDAWDLPPGPQSVITGYEQLTTLPGGAQYLHPVSGRQTLSFADRVNPGQTGGWQVRSVGLNGLRSLFVPLTPVPFAAAAAYAPDAPTLNGTVKWKQQPSRLYAAALAWVPGGEGHGPHDSYLVRCHTPDLPSVPDRFLQAGGGDIGLAFPGLTGGVRYAFYVRAVSAPNWQGDESSPATSTAPGGGTVPGSGYSDPERDISGWTPSDPALITPDAGGGYKSPGAIVFAPDPSTAPTLVSDPVPAIPGAVFGVDGYYRLDSGAAPTTLTGAWLWYDVPAPVYGTDTPFHTDTDTLTTPSGTWQRYAGHQPAPPVGAHTVAALIFRLTITQGAALGITRLDLLHAPAPTLDTAQIAPTDGLVFYHPTSGAVLQTVTIDPTTGQAAFGGKDPTSPSDNPIFSYSPAGVAIAGVTTTNTGVQGSAETTGTGVVGESTDGTGLVGSSTNGTGAHVEAGGGLSSNASPVLDLQSLEMHTGPKARWRDVFGAVQGQITNAGVIQPAGYNAPDGTPGIDATLLISTPGGDRLLTYLSGLLTGLTDSGSAPVIADGIPVVAGGVPVQST